MLPRAPRRRTAEPAQPDAAADGPRQRRRPRRVWAVRALRRHWLVAALLAAGLALRVLAQAAYHPALVAPVVVISHRQDAAALIRRPGVADLRILFHDYFGAPTIVAVLLAGCAVAAVLPARGTSRPRTDGAAAQAGATSEAGWWRRGGIGLPSVAAPLLVVPAAMLFGESLVAWPLSLIVTSSMARQEQPCWPAPAWTGSGDGWARQPAESARLGA